MWGDSRRRKANGDSLATTQGPTHVGSQITVYLTPQRLVGEGKWEEFHLENISVISDIERGHASLCVPAWPPRMLQLGLTFWLGNVQNILWAIWVTLTERSPDAALSGSPAKWLIQVLLQQAVQMPSILALRPSHWVPCTGIQETIKSHWYNVLVPPWGQMITNLVAWIDTYLFPCSPGGES